MSQTLGQSDIKNNPDIGANEDGVDEDRSLGSPEQNPASSRTKDLEWAQELRRADERTNEMRQKY